MNSSKSTVSLLVLLLLAVLLTALEAAVIRERRDVVADYGLKLSSGEEQVTTHRHRLHRHRRTPNAPEKRHAKICYFSPIQCLFTRPTQTK